MQQVRVGRVDVAVHNAIFQADVRLFREYRVPAIADDGAEKVELRFLLDDEDHRARRVNRDLKAFERGAAHEVKGRIMPNVASIENENVPQEQLGVGDGRVERLLHNETNVF